ncbi:hypothetical protein [Mesorhizobium sp.]|uniref:hypothetical protein n=1 Tax=Mesorhizobium sp. TaxID=1871066 RepID=UPI0025811B12|nr:hypothetical protein [Mesorhizobium sp.]
MLRRQQVHDRFEVDGEFVSVAFHGNLQETAVDRLAADVARQIFGELLRTLAIDGLAEGRRAERENNDGRQNTVHAESPLLFFW